MKDEIIINKEMQYIIIGNTKYYGIASELLDYIINLQESEAYYYGYYKDYKSRIDKAIECIKEEIIPFGNEWHWDNVSIEDYVKDLLNILQGEDKE